MKIFNKIKCLIGYHKWVYTNGILAIGEGKPTCTCKHCGLDSYAMGKTPTERIYKYFYTMFTKPKPNQIQEWFRQNDILYNATRRHNK